MFAELEKFVQKFNRMCSFSECDEKCPIYAITGSNSCYQWVFINPREIYDKVIEWDEAHPVPTNKEIFLSLFRNHPLPYSTEDGCTVCPEIPCFNCKWWDAPSEFKEE